MSDPLARLYADHLAALTARADLALAAAGRAHLVIAAGMPAHYFLDDRPAHFIASPHFLHWLPLNRAPGSWLCYTPGQRPRLIFLQPRDYWHVVPDAPSGVWVDHFEIVTIRTPEEARGHLPEAAASCAVIGPADTPGGLPCENPQAVLDRMHWDRAIKTPYETLLMRVASRIGARAHLAAETAFRAGASEFEIHLAYLAASGLSEAELPYANIIALNHHGAVLHYTDFVRTRPVAPKSLLIDAGGQYAGYASDITRTHAAASHDDFAALIASMEALQQDLCAGVRAGRSYVELHLEAHRLIADVLAGHRLVCCSAEAAFDRGITRTFFPHGLGHLLGLQVHDIGGHQAAPDGGTLGKPEGHPYLRLTRTLQPGMVVTIEPGLYFIGMLLDELRASPAGADVDWARVDAFMPYGGIRIEDDVQCTAGVPLNLTREAFAALG